jgi:hypothetical protein
VSTLADAAAAFVARYHARPALVAEQRGWDCTIALLATDTGERVTVRVAGGRVAEVHAPDEPARLVVRPTTRRCATCWSCDAGRTSRTCSAS